MGKKTAPIEKIISTATDVFAESGFSGARVDEIARRAGINKTTIYYKIGNKEALYSSVLKSMFEKSLGDLEANIKGAVDPEERLKIYIHSAAKAIDNNPRFPNILMWEHASGGKTLPPDIILLIKKMLTLLISILDDGEKAGVFKKRNPIVIHMMVIAVMTFFKTSTPIRKNNTELPEVARQQPDELSGDIAKELEELIFNGIRQ